MANLVKESPKRTKKQWEGFLNVRDRVDLNKRKLEELQNIDVKRTISDYRWQVRALSEEALSVANETFIEIKTESRSFV